LQLHRLGIPDHAPGLEELVADEQHAVGRGREHGLDAPTLPHREFSPRLLPARLKHNHAPAAFRFRAAERLGGVKALG
jgi:hypothetical protein